MRKGRQAILDNIPSLFPKKEFATDWKKYYLYNAFLCLSFNTGQRMLHPPVMAEDKNRAAAVMAFANGQALL
ncbi:MAG TPA: hypothetical protein PLE68_04960 [Bacillota bacterium]|nr:hypothetical protein [Bacillota bacterium]